jgi:protein SCO1/2
MRFSIIILSIWVCFNLQLNAQVIQPGIDGQIGINEKLGKTVPLDLKFVNEKNDTVSLGQLIDRPTILTLVYFDCPGICTPLLEGVSEVIEEMDMEVGKDYKVISISFNPNDNSTKAVSKKSDIVCDKCKAKNENWTYLTGDSAAINRILTSVGFSIKRVGNDFLHPGAIMVLSPKGVITRYLYGIKFMPLDLKLALIEAQDGLARPTVHRVLQFCYSYDPVGKRYGLEITKLLGTFILILVVFTFIILFFYSRKKSQKAKNE